MSRRPHAAWRTRHRSGSRGQRDARPDARPGDARTPRAGPDARPRLDDQPRRESAGRPEPQALPPAPAAPRAPAAPPVTGSAGERPGERPGAPPAGPAPGPSGCTAPQLRRFIKSRAYVPLHELRRRFGINGVEDDVTAIELDGRRIFVGLPRREGDMLADLFRGGEVGYELSLDPRSPVVVGVYPMRPVPRA